MFGQMFTVNEQQSYISCLLVLRDPFSTDLANDTSQQSGHIIILGGGGGMRVVWMQSSCDRAKKMNQDGVTNTRTSFLNSVTKLWGSPGTTNAAQRPWYASTFATHKNMSGHFMIELINVVQQQIPITHIVCLAVQYHPVGKEKWLVLAM